MAHFNFSKRVKDGNGIKTKHEIFAMFLVVPFSSSWVYESNYHTVNIHQDMNGHKSKRGPAHVRFDRGERPFWWATGSKKVATVFRKKMTEERTSNIFSPNYSVGTVLCTLECPGSGMVWWVMTGAKPRPPHIVLLVDFPYSLVSICGTSALPLPSWPGGLTARFQPQSPSARAETVRIC